MEASNSEVASALRELESGVALGGGTIAPDFTIREENAYFSAHVAPGGVGRVLLSYPLELRPPMDHLSWADDLERMIPEQGLQRLTPQQRRIVLAWVRLMNLTRKLDHVRRHVARFALNDWQLRFHIAEGGFPLMREPPSLTALRGTVVAWHSSDAAPSPSVLDSPAEQPMGRNSANPSAVSRPWRLIALKCFVNHHPAGANQNPVPGRVAVAAATPKQTDETFENYGDLDAMQLLMNFGYLDDAAPLVHSVPVEVESPHLGKVVVRWRAPRNPRGNQIARDVPILRPTDEGFELRHLTARPANRGRIVTFLAMAVQTRAGLSHTDARTAAESLVDDIAQANLAYFRRLDELVVEAMSRSAPPIVEGFGTDEILPTIASMSLLQQERLNSMWGQ